jgi:hypothetical protein
VQKGVVAGQKKVHAGFNCSGQVQGILCRKALLFDKPFRPVADCLRWSLMLAAQSGQAKHFNLPVWEGAQPGFVFVHERPNKFDFTLIGPADNLEAGERLDPDSRIERIVEGALKAIVIEVNELHLLALTSNKTNPKQRVQR